MRAPQPDRTAPHSIRETFDPKSQFKIGQLIQQIFPAALRSTDLAFTYALGITVFGGSSTYMVTWLVGVTGDPMASAYYVLATNLVTLAAVFVARRTG
ncbi:MAG: hypothetical protein AB1586_21165 [Pseudomonadota bacterium]